MEGRHIAVFASIIIWIVGYFISIFYFSQKLSSGIIPARFRENTKSKNLTYFMLGMPFLSSILAGFIYRLGGLLEKGNGIAWGCYIDDFWLGTLFLWLLSLICLFCLLVISLIKPYLFGFQDRKRALAFYFIHHLYTLLLLIIIEILIPFLSGPLTGKDSSCL